VILDEIGDMPLDLQLDLLCVLEGRKVQRMGEYGSRDIDVRVIAVCNRSQREFPFCGLFASMLTWREEIMPPYQAR
jgi:transcriptional regulator with PAS, ATPase and Fis domain